MTLTELYFFTVIVPNIGEAFGVICCILVACTIACGIGVVVNSDCDDDAVKSWRSAAMKFLLALGITAFISVPIPSENQMYMLAGGYVVTNTKDVKKLPDNVIAAANAWLEKAAKAADDKKPATK